MKPKTPITKPTKKRVDVFERVYFDKDEVRFNVGDECLVECIDELERLTEIGVIKSTFKTV